MTAIELTIWLAVALVAVCLIRDAHQPNEYDLCVMWGL